MDESSALRNEAGCEEGLYWYAGRGVVHRHIGNQAEASRTEMIEPRPRPARGGAGSTRCSPRTRWMGDRRYGKAGGEAERARGCPRESNQHRDMLSARGVEVLKIPSSQMAGRSVDVST